MHPKKLDETLKELNPHLTVRRYWNKRGTNDGIYFGEKYICALPSGYVFIEKVNEYHNMFNVPHRSLLNLFDILWKGRYINWRDRWKLLQ